MSSKLNVMKIVKDGRELLIREAKEAEAGKRGVLRAGNTGLRLSDGRITGKCHNLTLLRFIGIDLEENDYSKELMFEAGRRNEDSFVAALQQQYKGPILREEEAQIRWLTQNGTEVTGRPDVVLAKKMPIQLPRVGVGFLDIPQHVIELKLVSSLWTALSVIQGNPKLAHLIQAAHYSWQLSVGATLLYTSRTNFALPGWADKNVKRDNPLLEGKLSFDKYDKIKAVLPFEQGYAVNIGPDGAVYFDTLNSNGEVINTTKTIVSVQAIQDYYNFISTQLEKNTLGPIPVNLDATGEKENWPLSQYCPAGTKCCMFKEQREGALNEWIEEVKELKK